MQTPFRFLSGFLLVVLATSGISESPHAQQTRRRGANIPQGSVASDLQSLAGYNANLVRWQLVTDRGAMQGNPYGTFDEQVQYLWWYFGEIDEAMSHLIANILPTAESLGIDVFIDLHTPPGFVPYTRYFNDPPPTPGTPAAATDFQHLLPTERRRPWLRSPRK